MKFCIIGEKLRCSFVGKVDFVVYQVIYVFFLLLGRVLRVDHAPLDLISMCRGMTNYRGCDYKNERFGKDFFVDKRL